MTALSTAEYRDPPHILDCPSWGGGECSDECGAWLADPDAARDAAISDDLRRGAA